MAKQDLTTPRGPELPMAFPRAFGSLQREIDRLFDDFGRGWDRVSSTVAFPKIDVGESDGEIEITAELPGLEEKDISISVSDNLLTVSGEKRTESERKDKAYSISERSYGAFSRTIALPPGVDPAAVKATVSKGVLKVVVPKPASAKAAKIEVKSA
ncbi:MAG: Hsp20/alpha crystallin family protein [Caulobacteraceae bacterium]|nr:Hsp20/alpha crystallin family protein [Caulobacteraceae bacterium]